MPLSDTYRDRIQRANNEIARLQRMKGQKAQTLAGISQKISNASQTMSRASSPAIIKAKMAEVARYRTEETRVQKTIAALETAVASEQRRLAEAQGHLTWAEERDQRRREQAASREARRQETRLQGMSGTLAQHDTLHQRTFEALRRLTALPDQIVVLFLASNPLDQPELRLDEEVRSITEMIRKSEHRDAVRLQSCWAVRPLDVLQALNEHEPRVVHFSGHGSDQDEIIFQDDAGFTKAVTKEAIVQTMAAASGEIVVVFFNTCYSRDQAEAVVTHVPAAIGMNTDIGDQAARIFAAQFYSAIGFGLSVQKAFDQAKAALVLEGIREENTPELFLAEGVDANHIFLVKPPDNPNALNESA